MLPFHVEVQELHNVVQGLIHLHTTCIHFPSGISLLITSFPSLPSLPSWGRVFSLILEKSFSLLFLLFASEAPRRMDSYFYRNTKTRKHGYKSSLKHGYLYELQEGNRMKYPEKLQGYRLISQIKKSTAKIEEWKKNCVCIGNISEEVSNSETQLLDQVMQIITMPS